MRILLDTHIALWILSDDPRLSKNARVLIEDETNELYISTVSLWEIEIKNNKRPEKMKTNAKDFLYYCNQAGFIPLAIDNNHVINLTTLSDKHNDPFDRMLLSQAGFENLKLMTHDSKIISYDVDYILAV